MGESKGEELGGSVATEVSVGAGDDAGFPREGYGIGCHRWWGNEELTVEKAEIGVLEDHGCSGSSVEGGQV